PFGAMESQIWDLVIQEDGFIVAGGEALDQAALARYNPWGMADPGFGTGGTVGIDLGPEQILHGVALQSDGKVVAASEGNALLPIIARDLGNTANLVLD